MRRARCTAAAERALRRARRRRVWGSLGLTCLAVGGSFGALALLGLSPVVWEIRGELRGYLSAEQESAEEPPTEPLQALPELPYAPPPLPELVVAEERAIAPAQAEYAAEPELPPVASPLFALPEQELSPRPTEPRRPAPRPTKPVAAQAAAPAAEAPAGDYTPPAYRHTPQPPYPAAMRQSRLEGSVRLRIFLDAEGRPLRVEVADSSGHAEFDTAARTWVQRHWEFTPARQGGRPVPGTVVTRVHFVLN